jgi:hypothetical protein
MSTPIPDVTPNVNIENPVLRKRLRTILDLLGLAVVTAAAVDLAAPAFDILAWTAPALAGYAVLRAGFGFGVDNPNTPTAEKAIVTETVRVDEGHGV